MATIFDSSGFWTVVGAAVAAISGMAVPIVSAKLQNKAKVAERHTDYVERLRCEQIENLETLSKLLVKWARYCGMYYSSLRGDLKKHADDPKKARGDSDASEKLRVVTGEISVVNGKILDPKIRESVRVLVSDLCFEQDDEAVWNWMLQMARRTSDTQDLIAERRRSLETQNLSAQEMKMFGRLES